MVCLLTQDAPRELRTFLERHLTFLAALPTWTLRVVIPAHMTAYGMRFVDEARRGLRWRFDGQWRDDIRWYFETRRAGGNPDAVSDDDERAHRARLRRFSGLGFSALYPLWVAKGDDVFPTVAAQVGGVLFREAGVSSNRWCCRTPTATWRRWWAWRRRAVDGCERSASFVCVK
ncbi:MAG: hypothetical protein ACT4QD_01210 [Acidobacteriota bacterium]